MKTIKCFFALNLIFLWAISPAFSQSVVSERIADLMPQNYAITGDAVLQLLDNGELKLSLTDDFTTPRGPDVRILLGNELSLNGTEEIVDLTEINHFNGAATFDVPENINIGDFKFVLFYCVQFQQFWGSGEFTEAGDPGQDSICEVNSVALTTGAQSIELCATDGESDVFQFTNSLNARAGENYAYLITDENEIVQDVVLDSTFDFEGSLLSNLRVYGVHYQGDLTAMLNVGREQTTASICFTHSDAEAFVEIATDQCIDQFDCGATLVATTAWVTEVDLCPNDGLDDFIELRNNIGESTTDHYAYLITDSNAILQEVFLDTVYNFEGSGNDLQRVYGIHYDGTLQPAIGEPRTSTIATGCFRHSSDTTFLTISKLACSSFECSESLVATHDWISNVDLCDDGQSNQVFVQNNIQISPGQNYAFLLTDTMEIIREVFFDSIYDFESIEKGIYRVYGVSYAGELMDAVGQHRSTISATECSVGSGDAAFLTVIKSENCLTSTLDPSLAMLINIYPNPSQGLVRIEVPVDFIPERSEVYNSLGRRIYVEKWGLGSQVQLNLNHLTSGMYFLRLIDSDSQVFNHTIQLR